jgi:hypothetical protein
MRGALNCFVFIFGCAVVELQVLVSASRLPAFLPGVNHDVTRRVLLTR